MMPVKPSTLLEAVPQAGDTLATRMYKTFVLFPPLFYKIFKYMFSAAGGLTTEYAADLCEALEDCTTE